MTWEEKLDALREIGEISVNMRAPGNWYVSHTACCVWSCFRGGPYGNGDSPESAVENHWEIFTTLNAPGYEKLDCILTYPDKRYVRWAGHRWREYHRV